jgi:hypothetical protein
MKRQSLLNQLQPDQVERAHARIGREGDERQSFSVAPEDILQTRKIVKGQEAQSSSL